MKPTSECEHEWTYPLSRPIKDMKFEVCVKCGETRKRADPTMKRKLVACPRCHCLFGVELPGTKVELPQPQRTPHSELRAAWYWVKANHEWYPVKVIGEPPFLELGRVFFPDYTDPHALEFGPRIEEPETE